MSELNNAKPAKNGIYSKPNEFVLFLPEIKELLKNKDFNQLKNLIKNIHSIDLAEGWHMLDSQEKIIIFKLFSQHKAIEVFEDLRFQEQSFLTQNLGNTEISPILNEMAPDERVRFFKDLPEKIKKKLFSLMSKEEVDDVRKLLVFPEDSAGSLMTTEFAEIKKDMTARRAILHLQEAQKAGHTKAVYNVYIVDDSHVLLGYLSLQALINAPPDMFIKDVMQDTRVIRISVATPKDDVARHFRKYDLSGAPVVNEQNQIVGVITIDDVVDLIDKAATKDIYEIGKMQAHGGQEIRYSQTTVKELVRRRAGWLIVLLIFDFLTGTVLKNFEHALGSVVALTFFIPMLLDTGGNAGAQTSITLIRSLALGEINLKNIWRVVKLEVIAALLMGVIVGSVAFLRAFLLQQQLYLSLVVGITMTLIVLLAIATGICLPLLSKKVGLDPAVLAGPITTSVVDVVGLIIYFKIAQLILPALR